MDGIGRPKKGSPDEEIYTKNDYVLFDAMCLSRERVRTLSNVWSGDCSD